MKKFYRFFLVCLIAGCSADRTKEVDLAMRHYDQLVLHGQYDSIVDLFTTNAELAGEKHISVLGKDSIRKLLKSFRGATVFNYASTTQSTTFHGDTAVQIGTYVQVVKIPSGDTLELGGDYIGTWIPEKGVWKIAKMYTHHYKNLKEQDFPNRLPDKSVAKQYGKTILSAGVNAANLLLENLRKDSVNYYINEKEFNHLGYNLMGKDKNAEALEVFKTTLQLFPFSWNAFDSYGEALLHIGDKLEAAKMYQRSIELNPRNENATKMLEKINNGS